MLFCASSCFCNSASNALTSPSDSNCLRIWASVKTLPRRHWPRSRFCRRSGNSFQNGWRSSEQISFCTGSSSNASFASGCMSIVSRLSRSQEVMLAHGIFQFFGRQITALAHLFVQGYAILGFERLQFAVFGSCRLMLASCIAQRKFRNSGQLRDGTFANLSAICFAHHETSCFGRLTACFRIKALSSFSSASRALLNFCCQ